MIYPKTNLNLLVVLIRIKNARYIRIKKYKKYYQHLMDFNFHVPKFLARKFHDQSILEE